MRIVIVGAAGQLGRSLHENLHRDHNVIAATRRELDASDGRAVDEMIRAAKPDAIVNAAAYTNVDGAEDAPLAALDGNAFAVRNLARAAAEAGATFVHYSTDFVFDGRGPREPYTEDDPPNPRSVYAASKLLGEWFAADAPAHYVLRVESLFGGPTAKSSIDRIADAIAGGREARVFADRTVSPSFTTDVVAATRHMLELRAPCGVYHCVNSGFGTWLDVGRTIASVLNRPEAQLIPVSVKDVSLRADRPQYAALSNAKLRGAGVDMPAWQDAIARYIRSRS